MGVKGRKRAIFLDRDGVLNPLIHTGSGKMRPPWNLQELRVFPEAVEIIGDPCLDDWLKVVVTNQPDVARGELTQESLGKINQKISQTIPSIDSFRVCEHDNDDNCLCRKPHPGLLISAAIDLGIDLGTSFMIGDRWVDIAAGQNAGTKTILINSEYSWLPSSMGAPPDGLDPDFRVTSLRDLLSILRQQF